MEYAEREQLLGLAEQANRPGWWHRHTDILPEWFQAYVGLEESARSIRIYEPQFVPACCRPRSTPALSWPWATSPPKRGTARAGPQGTAAALRPRRPEALVIVEEPALRRPVSNVRTQQEQIAYLREASERSNLTLQVVPYGVGGHAVPSGFSVLRFGDRELPDVVYVEHLTSALYLDKQSDVDQYMLAMERLTIVSAPPSATAEILKSIISDLDGPGSRLRNGICASQLRGVTWRKSSRSGPTGGNCVAMAALPASVLNGALDGRRAERSQCGIPGNPTDRRSSSPPRRGRHSPPASPPAWTGDRFDGRTGKRRVPLPLSGTRHSPPTPGPCLRDIVRPSAC